MKDLLIIGGVASGATAAARARRLNNDVNITILEAGADVSFANCGLPYYLGGDIEYRSSLILASPETFDDQYKVKVYTNTQAIEIDRENKIVKAVNTETKEQHTFPYDSLILAQGGKPIIPPLKGVDKKHVFQLWTLKDMDEIDLFLYENNPKKAVVVGGGFIGLEMVEALVKRGMEVTLVEMAPQVLPNLEGEFAGFITKELLDYGVKLKLGTSLQEVEDDKVILSDGTSVETDFVLLSIGVRPTLQLAKDANLELGKTGSLLVNEQLMTNDPAIFAAGDMVEIEDRVLGKHIRVPLAGPANRQGRIAGENALGGSRVYKGTSTSSIVKVFEAVAGSTGMSLKAARDAGFSADAIVIHKVSHTAYYKGAEMVSVMLIWDRATKKILGGQVAGYVGIDKRIDVLATAIAGGLTIEDLGELGLSYAPPFNSPNDPVNMASFTAVNHDTGFSPSILAQDLELFVNAKQPVVIDLRDPITFSKAHVYSSNNISQGSLRENLDRIPEGAPILLISDDGQKSHVVLRMLKGSGFDEVYNLSGGYTSIERHERAIGYKHLSAGLFPITKKKIKDETGLTDDVEVEEEQQIADVGPVIIDVRTPMEFNLGAVPNAINVGLDVLKRWAQELGDHDREIIIYCATGARSSYGVRLLQQVGFTNVSNGGSLHEMIERFPLD
jgi:NADPH-dependent 2,4-dienoyl-CoA reductase/sulfur reductase-like enzyme/rhodanese-related sulfurtransferase